MSNQLEARIRKVEDFQDITNLQAKYSFLIDTSQIGELVTLFAKEFVWEVGFKKMTKVASKADLFDLLTKAAEGNSFMIHQPVTPYIEVNGDEAQGTWYLTGMITSIGPQGEQAKWIQGQYNNEYVREDGIWKIRRLSFRYNFLTPFDEGWVKTPFARFWN